MRVLKLIIRNSLRHSLRTSLTVLGVAIAVMAFCVIRSTIDAWYLGAEAASPDRLWVRNRISLTFELPVSYCDKIAKLPGVKDVSSASWFGGVYIDESNFFAKFAVDHHNYFKMYPEYVIDSAQWENFVEERRGAIVGRRLADRFGWKIGDKITIQGDIYPGTWEFIISGIYTGAKENTDESTFFFRYDYLDDRMRADWPGRAGHIGSAIVQIEDPSQSAKICSEIDSLFANSLAETKTETEEAFVLGFISMSEAIIIGLRVVSFMVIGIILLVMANTLAMAARERTNEYALLKTLGFRSVHLMGLVYGESLTIAGLGGVLGLLLAAAFIPMLEQGMSDFMPKVPFTALTIALGLVSAIVVGLLAAIFPTAHAIRTSIVDGLRPID